MAMTVREFMKSGILATTALVAVERPAGDYIKTEFMGYAQNLPSNMDSWYQDYEIKSLTPKYMKAFDAYGLLITI